MKIEVTGTEELDDGELRLEIEYDQEFADLAIRKFILWSIEKQLMEETVTDHWEDVRERLHRAEETEAAFPVDDLDKFVSPGAQQATADVACLLADADALLAVVPYAQHKIGCELWPNGVCDCGLDKALAALPEHLK